MMNQTVAWMEAQGNGSYLTLCPVTYCSPWRCRIQQCSSAVFTLSDYHRGSRGFYELLVAYWLVPVFADGLL